MIFYKSHLDLWLRFTIKGNLQYTSILSLLNEMRKIGVTGGEMINKRYDLQFVASWGLALLSALEAL